MRGFVPYGHVPHGSFHSKRDSTRSRGRTRSTLNQVWRNLSRSFMKADEAPDVWRLFITSVTGTDMNILIAGVTF